MDLALNIIALTILLLIIGAIRASAIPSEQTKAHRNSLKEALRINKS